jgi:predicted TIM-barrel fold metal-dependent hydrolase
MGYDCVISGDSHIIEPFDLWTKSLGKKYGDALPRLVDEYQGTKEPFFFTGFEYIGLSAIGEGDKELQDRLLKAGMDPVARMECMKEDGVYAEVINPTWGLFLVRAKNDDMVRDCCAVYNDWVAEYASHAPKVLIGTALIHMADIDWAVRELYRCAKKGYRSVMINCDTRPNWAPYRDVSYDRFWAAACELKIPVTLHIVTGEEIDLFVLHGKDRENLVRASLGVFGEGGPVLANEFMFGGVFDRFPDLKVMLSEFEVSWLPYFMFRVRQVQDDFAPVLNVRGPKKKVDEYMANQVYHGLIDDPYVGKVIDVINPRTLMWGSDFPHVRCTYPRTHQVLERLFREFDPEVREDIIWRNTARLYRIEPPKGMTLN